MRVEIIASAFALAAALCVGFVAENAALAADAAPAATASGRTASPAGAKVYFINIQNGARVKSPVLVQFGLSGMGIAPFGLTGPGTQNTGHHHLIVDSPPPALDVPIPADMTHVHYGRGQTEATVMLAPGQHTLQLVLADALHIPHDPPVMSERITITVEP
jgi:hypothetical protein